MAGKVKTWVWVVLGIVVVIVSAGVSRFERWLLQWKAGS